jgi:hypothetical protein
MSIDPAGRTYVSYYPSKKPKGGKPYRLKNALEDIRSGRHRDAVAACRALAAQDTDESRAEYSAKKAELPGVTFAAVFLPNEREKEAKCTPSGYVVLDFDGLSPNQAVAKRERLRDDPHIYAAWLSVGHGVKALLRVDISGDADIKAMWPFVEARYPGVDASGKDISRLCFVSYDPDLWTNEAAQPLPWIDQAAQHPLPLSTDKEPPPSQRDTPVGNPTQGASDAARHVANTVRKGLAAKKDNPSASRHTWMRSACVVGQRYVLGGHMAEAEVAEIVKQEYGAEFAGDTTRMRDVDRALAWARDVARDKGALHPESQGQRAVTAAQRREQRQDVDDVTADRISELLGLCFAPEADNEPEHVPPVLTFAEDVPVAAACSITGIVASYSTGKSTVSAAIWSAYYVEEDRVDEIDTLGFTVTRPGGKPYALYFDTEQAHPESWHSWRRAMKRSEIGQQHADASGTYVNLHDVPTNIDRQAILWWYLEEAYSDLAGLVIIDGFADMINNVNDAEEVDDFMQRLRRCANKNRMAIVVTIHENIAAEGKDTKARGHLGSDLLRRGYAVLRLTKNSNTGVHTITAAKARGGRQFTKWCFQFDEEAGTHRSVPVDSVILPAHDPTAAKLAEAMKPGVPYKRSALEDMLTEIAPDIAGKTKDAKKKHVGRIITKAKQQGLILTANKTGFYIRPVVDQEGDDDGSQLPF